MVPSWREATQPLTTRELAERIMRLKAIPAADDQRRERIQKTLLSSLNRAKQARARAAQRGQARAAIAEMRRLLAVAEAGE